MGSEGVKAETSQKRKAKKKNPNKPTISSCCCKVSSDIHGKGGDSKRQRTSARDASTSNSQARIRRLGLGLGLGLRGKKNNATRTRAIPPEQTWSSESNDVANVGE